MKKITILTGAGISAPSGLRTFRDDGIWNEHHIDDVCTPRALKYNYDLVQSFYADLKAKSSAALPNLAHKALVDLEDKAYVTIITQNIDDLHERAGSSDVIHMHGSLYTKANTPDGRPRPDVVFFGENPKFMKQIMFSLDTCDEFWVIGTSGVVYPAAGFAECVSLAGRKKIVYFNINADHTPSFEHEFNNGDVIETLPKYIKSFT